MATRTPARRKAAKGRRRCECGGGTRTRGFALNCSERKPAKARPPCSKCGKERAYSGDDKRCVSCGQSWRITARAASAKARPKRGRGALSLNPQHVATDCWYYEERRGINVVKEIRTPQGDYIRTEQFVIPWRMLQASLARRGGGKA
jgi:hypothetical protein